MRILALLSSLIVTSTALAAAGSVVRSQDPVPGEYIVIFRSDIQSPVRPLVAELARTHSLAAEHIYETALKGFSFRGSDIAAQALTHNPNVKYVAEATKMYPTSIGTQGPTPPTPSWGLDRINQALLPLDGIYNWGWSGVGVVAYVIDSGISPTTDLPAFRIRENRSFVPNEPAVNDLLGHGTYVADIIGGANYGVARDVVFVNYRVLDHAGTFASDATVVEAVDAMTSDHVNNHPAELAVANMSLSTLVGGSDTIDRAVLSALTAGVTVVVSAGNVNSLSPNPDACSVSPARGGSPGSYTNNPNGFSAISVGATNSSDGMWPNSKYGGCVDIFAPGEAVEALRIDSASSVVLTGTSFAAPHVTGVVALHLERTAIANSPSVMEGFIKDNGNPNRLSGLGAGSPNLLLNTSVQRRRACCAY